MTKKPFAEEKKYKWPKKREGNRYCEICNSTSGMIRKYSMQICRRCFREKANELGFDKFG
jgi:small subunit ribosomal protein S29e